MYSEGREVPQNDAEAVRWYRLAADQGNAVAQVNLGWMYLNGRGVSRDCQEAHRLTELASASGLAEATTALGSWSCSQ